MVRKQTIAAIRFGYGLGPRRPPETPDTLLANLGTVPDAAGKFPVMPTSEAVRMARDLRRKEKLAAKRGGKSGAAGAKTRANAASAADDPVKAARRKLRLEAGRGLVHGMARILDARSALGERLVWFWADHFTAVPKNQVMRLAAPAYIDEAIRPHVTGRFADMLKAVVTHPFMLFYLDQVVSAGPNSAAGKRRGAGLNENLAREVMELHTLGVGAPYGQDDVRQLAELMTGLTLSRKTFAFEFNPRMAEPGAETVLGKAYGGGKPRLDDILQALENLAAHPATARHIARKLAVHFVSDTPDAALVDALEAAYRRSDGDLMAVYSALLEHPLSWGDIGGKAKQPFDFIASALVALGISGDELAKLKPRELDALLFRSLAAMGQPFMQARGPDGWPEEAEAWITPQGLAARIDWATQVAARIGNRVGDAGRFLDTTLADAAGERLRWAVQQVESASDGVALVFASAEFNRR